MGRLMEDHLELYLKNRYGLKVSIEETTTKEETEQLIQLEEDLRSAKTAVWKEDYWGTTCCSNCNQTSERPEPYCCKCGARMTDVIKESDI